MNFIIRRVVSQLTFDNNLSIYHDVIGIRNCDFLYLVHLDSRLLKKLQKEITFLLSISCFSFDDTSHLPNVS